MANSDDDEGPQNMEDGNEDEDNEDDAEDEDNEDDAEAEDNEDSEEDANGEDEEGNEDQIDVSWILVRPVPGLNLQNQPILLRESFNLLRSSFGSMGILLEEIICGAQELDGFETCLVLHEGEVVSAATVRIFHAHHIAEIPLVATHHAFQGWGFCRILMDNLDGFLLTEGVTDVYLPSCFDVETMWNRFGFHRIPDEQLEIVLQTVPILTFHDTAMCHKHIL
ncbi:hypothetical protein TSUD_306420 [Trifolium subterraneum]|uniref:Increased DNA methylation 1 C-terminal domain-containing protein n=1 Tax=Trifolium subterraneum TaxID=3900 RepID=A0A2Z6NUG4_TRISU|nr:hypothetical protein TSUD_306420 [Trifolium subterraneum]